MKVSCTRIGVWIGTLLLCARLYASNNPIVDALLTHQYERALGLAESILAVHPGDARLLTLKGVALKGLSRHESLYCFEQALQADPDFEPALEGAAEAAYEFRDSRAAEFVNAMLKKHPDNPTANAMAAQIAFEANDYASAALRFERAEPLLKRPELAIRYAQSLIELRRAPEAVRRLRATIDANTGNELLCLNLGIAQMAAQQPAPAASTFRALLGGTLSRPELLTHLGRAEAAQGHATEAKQLFSEAILADPHSENAYLQLSTMLVDGGRAADAMTVVNKGLHWLPKSARLHLVRGAILAQRSAYDDAEVEFEKADRLDPGHAFGAVGQSVLQSALQQKDTAANLIRRRLQTSPGDYFLHYLLAEVLLSSGPDVNSAPAAEAQHALGTSIALHPAFPGSRVLLGKLLMRSHETGAAINQFRAALKVDSSNRTALYHLAVALRSAGALEDSAEAFRRFREASANLVAQGQ